MSTKIIRNRITSHTVAFALQEHVSALEFVVALEAVVGPGSVFSRRPASLITIVVVNSDELAVILRKSKLVIRGKEIAPCKAVSCEPTLSQVVLSPVRTDGLHGMVKKAARLMSRYGEIIDIGLTIIGRSYPARVWILIRCNSEK
ncbi:hypothetical protein IWW45_005951, partial [Coemansia sp. RSA 485]